MSEHDFPKPPPIKHVALEPATLVGSRDEFMEKANRQPRLTVAEHDVLFDAIADEQIRRAERARTHTSSRMADRLAAKEAQTARNQIATSFLSLVISKAYERKGSAISIDDLIGIGSLLLYKAIDKYAGLHEHNSFALYAEPTIRHGLGREIKFRRLGVRTSGGALDEIVNYRKRRAALVEKRGREVSAVEMAEDMEIDKAWAVHLECFAEDEIFLDDIGVPSLVNYLEMLMYKRHPENHEPEPALLAESREKKSIAIERGLAVISPHQADLLRLHYGLDGEPPLDVSEIAEKLQLQNVSVKAALNRGESALHEVLPPIQDGTFDYAEWQKSHPQLLKSVLAFLTINNIPIPDGYRLPELRTVARFHLEQVDCTARDQELITDFYGLRSDNRTFALKELIQKYNLSHRRIYDIEKRVTGKLQALREEQAND